MEDPYVPTAFPVEIVRDQYGNIYAPGSQGMSLRDWFAGMALSGVIVHDDTYDVAKAAYAIADEMLAARGTK